MRDMSKIRNLVLSMSIIGLAAVPTAGAAEPNDDFPTAEGPLTAGQTFRGNLETPTDVDYQFFYLPDPTRVSVTTINASQKRGGAEDNGRTIVTSVFRARKGKDPVIIADSPQTLRPKKKVTVKLDLLPGKYFIPIGHAQNNADPRSDVPFRLRIGPVGSTTDSYEIFEQRCEDAKRRLDRVKSSIKRTMKRIAKAKKNDAPTGKVVKLKLKLKDKRAKAKPLKKAEKFACSIPR